MPDLHRKSPRASRYDYTSPGGYFITICTKDREHYFGEIVDGKMILNDLGKITRDMRNNIPVFHPHVDTHEFICMPNHIHGILIIGENETNNNTHAVGTDGVGTHYMRPKQNGTNNKDRCNLSLPSVQCVSESLGSIIRGFKIGVTKYANEHDIVFARQSRYHDHIIRDEGDYDRITYYIQTNPQNRNKDTFNK